MRRSDIFTVTFVASVGVLLTFIACSFLLGDPDTRYLKHKTIGKITADLMSPDPEVFNVDAINPTVEVYVGSCEDVDRNGILDRAELVACGRATPETAAEEEKKEKAEEKKKKKPKKLLTAKRKILRRRQIQIKLLRVKINRKMKLQIKLRKLRKKIKGKDFVYT